MSDKPQSVDEAFDNLDKAITNLGKEVKKAIRPSEKFVKALADGIAALDGMIEKRESLTIIQDDELPICPGCLNRKHRCDCNE